MYRVRIVLLAAFLLLWASPVYAASVALLHPSSASPEVTEALFRLQGELLSVGLEVQIMERPARLDSASMARNSWFEQMAAERKLDAIIDVVGDPIPVGVDVWILQRSSHRFEVSRVMLEPNTPNAPETLAIRAIEVLRSNFLVFDLAGKQRGDRPPPELAHPTSSQPPTQAKRFGLAAGATVLTSLDGVGPALLPALRFDWATPTGFGATATLSGFGTRPTVETQAGSVRVSQDYGVLGLRYLTPSDSSLGAFFSLGAGAFRTTLDGSADSPNRGHRVDQWALVLEGSLGAELEVSERYYLSLAAHAQLTEPYVAIHFVDARVATTGRPNLLWSLTFGAWL